MSNSALTRGIGRLLVAVAAILLVTPLALFAQDPDDDLSVTVFMGSSIDSFAAADLRQYINPDDSGGAREQLVAGFDFQLRAFATRYARVFLYGETVHGARSGEVDCTVDANSARDVCKIASLEVPSSKAALGIFRKATTLEGFFGLRADLSRPDARSAFFVKSQLGFLSVAGKGGDIVDMHHVGIGLIRRAGAFVDSYFELGVGRNDLFKKNTGRTQIDGYLTFGRGSEPRAKPFFQMVIDSDFGNGPDNIQTFIGLELDVRNLFK